MTTERLTRRVLNFASNNVTSISQIRGALHLEASRATIGRILQTCDHIRKLKMKRKPRLTNEHKITKVKWARQAITERRDWFEVIFPDEKRFNLDGPDGYRYYWRDLRKEPRYFSKRVQGGGGVIVWGCFSSLGLHIAFVEGKLNAQRSTQLLEQHFLPFADLMARTNCTFQQDNAPCHSAQLTRNWFETNDVNVLPWPSVSPDMNPIENVWGLMVRQLYADGDQFNSVQHLIEV